MMRTTLAAVICLAFGLAAYAVNRAPVWQGGAASSGSVAKAAEAGSVSGGISMVAVYPQLPPYRIQLHFDVYVSTTGYGTDLQIIGADEYLSAYRLRALDLIDMCLAYDHNYTFAYAASSQ